MDVFSSGQSDHVVNSPPADLYRSLAAQLDFSSQTFQLAEGVESASIENDFQGHSQFVIKNTDNHYLRLREDEKFLIDQLKEPITPKDLAVLYFLEYSKLADQYIESFMQTLYQQNFLVPAYRNLYGELNTVLAGNAEASSLKKILGRKVLYAYGIDEKLDAIYRMGGKFFCHPGNNFLFLVLAAYAWVFCSFSLWPKFHHLDFLHEGGSLVLGVGVLLVIKTLLTSLHELAHGLSVKYYGRRVIKGGLVSHFGIPCFFVDTNDIWMKSKKDRIVVSLAGPYSTFLVISVLMILLHHVPGLPAQSLFLKTILWGVLSVVLNLNPLLYFDGYFILIDLINFPMLREKAVSELKRLGPQFLAGQLSVKTLLSRETLLLSLYCLLSLFWMIGSLITVFVLLGKRLRDLLIEFYFSNSLLIKGSIVLIVGIFIFPLLLTVCRFLFQSARDFHRRLGQMTFLRKPWVKVGGALVVHGVLVWLVDVPRGPWSWESLLLRGSVIRFLVPAVVGALLLASNLHYFWRQVKGKRIFYPFLLLLAAYGGALLLPIGGAGTVFMGVLILGVLVEGRKWIGGPLGVYHFYLLLGIAANVIFPPHSLMVNNLYHWSFYLFLVAEKVESMTVRKVKKIYPPQVGDLSKILMGTQFLFDHAFLYLSSHLGSTFSRHLFPKDDSRETGVFYQMNPGGTAELTFLDHFPGDIRAASPLLAREISALERSLVQLLGKTGERVFRQILDDLYWVHRELLQEYVFSGGKEGFSSTYTKKVSFLKGVGPFREMEDHHLRWVMDRMTLQAVQEGESIIKEGTLGEKFYIVEEGLFNVMKEERSVAILTRGDIFGERALFLGEPRSADVAAKTGGKLLCMQKDDFHYLLEEFPSFKRRMKDYIDSGFKFSDFLRSIPLFSKVGDQEMNLVLQNVRFGEYARDQVIFNEGDEGDRFYIIKDGQVEIFLPGDGARESKILSRLGRGEFFGEIGLFRKIKRTASVKALEKTILLEITRDDFQKVFGENALVDRISSRRVKEKDCLYSPLMGD